MKQALREALEARGYDTLTPVQEAVLAPELAGRDLLVSAQTGSGKTLGFGLAIAPTILGEAEQFAAAGAPLGLVIAPTRELALQVKRELAWLFEKAGAVLTSCVGGMDMRDERRALARGAHIVVATPGRLRDHIMRGAIDLSALRAVVLDEADEMLDLGFREDLEFILGEAPEARQTLLFSATVPAAIAKLAQSYQQEAERLIVKSETSQHADIAYQAMMVAESDVEKAVINTLLYHQAPNAIVFANTRATVNRLTTRLANRGLPVVSLSGELTQSERTHALQAMRDGRARICVATDVAARGIDLPNLDLVIHAELPGSHETLLHRSGRTGRAGRKGVSALVVTRKSRKKAERILGMARLKADWTEAPSAEEVSAREEERMLADDVWQSTASESEEAAVTRLAEGQSAEQLALAYLRLYRSVRSAPEELSDPEAKPAPRPEFGESVWFAISGGRDAGAEPRRLLPMLIKTAPLTKEDIGAIRVRQEQSFVQVRADRADALEGAVGPDGMIEPGAQLSRLAEPPALGGTGPRPGGKPGGKPFKRPERAERPRREERPAPRAERPAKAANPGAPIDWNDAPAPRAKKPKPKDRAAPAAKAGKERRPAADPAVVRPRKPRTKPKGPPPPKGKPTSKKNKLRAAAAKQKGKPGTGRGKD